MCIPGEGLPPLQRQNTRSAAWRTPRTGSMERRLRTAVVRAGRKEPQGMPKQNHSARYEPEGRDDALEAYLLEHAPGLREHDAPSTEPSSRSRRMGAVPIQPQTISLRRKRRRLPSRPGRGRRLNCVEASCLWQLTFPVRSGAAGSASFSGISGRGTEPTPTPLTWELERTLTAEFMRTYEQ